MNRKIVFRIVSTLVLLAAVVGIAGFAFRAGMLRGAAMDWQPPAVQQNLAPEAMQNEQMPYAYYGHGMSFHRPFGLGCFGLLIPLFLFFLAAKAFRFMIFGPRWGHHMHGGHHGPWGRHGGHECGVPPMFNEWHKQAHETPKPEDGKPAEDKQE